MTYRIDEGPQWLVTKLGTEGIDEKDAAALLPRLSNSAGQPYSNVEYGRGSQPDLSYYYRRDIRKPRWNWSVAPSLDRHQVELCAASLPVHRSSVRDVKILGLTGRAPNWWKSAWTCTRAIRFP